MHCLAQSGKQQQVSIILVFRFANERGRQNRAILHNTHALCGVSSVNAI